jgi:hypothetical protein
MVAFGLVAFAGAFVAAVAEERVFTPAAVFAPAAAFAGAAPFGFAAVALALGVFGLGPPALAVAGFAAAAVRGFAGAFERDDPVAALGSFLAGSA